MKLVFKNKKKRKGMTWYLDKNDRVRKCHTYYSITTFDGYWWQHDQKRWIASSEMRGPASTHWNAWCRSHRAFKRRLRQIGKYLGPGVEFILFSRFDDYEIKGRT